MLSSPVQKPTAGLGVMALPRSRRRIGIITLACWNMDWFGPSASTGEEIATPMKLSDVQRALAVFAHPDDAEFNFGGTVARLTRLGAEVDYVCCTDGCRGGPDPRTPDAELAAIRTAEQRAAAAVLGVEDVEFLGYRNGTLEVTVELRRDIVRQIRRFKPDVILTMPPHRVFDAHISLSHAEHIAVGEATLIAVYPEARSIRSYPELLDEGLEPHRVQEVWIPAVGDANLLVDVSEFTDLKAQAIRHHRSQVEGWDFDRDLAPRMRAAGARLGCEYAETFQVVETG